MLDGKPPHPYYRPQSGSPTWEETRSRSTFLSSQRFKRLMLPKQESPFSLDSRDPQVVPTQPYTHSPDMQQPQVVPTDIRQPQEIPPHHMDCKECIEERNSLLTKRDPSHHIEYCLPLLRLTVRMSARNIVLSWSMSEEQHTAGPYYYCLFAAAGDSVRPPLHGDQWTQIGLIHGYGTSMEVALSEVTQSGRYHFSVLAVNRAGEYGPLSNPCTVAVSQTSEPL